MYFLKVSLSFFLLFIFLYFFSINISSWIFYFFG